MIEGSGRLTYTPGCAGVFVVFKIITKYLKKKIIYSPSFIYLHLLATV